MQKRKLRVVKRTPVALGVCELCNSQFHSNKVLEDDAESDMQSQFDSHKCQLTDSSQNAPRIVRESTEGK